MEIRTEVIIDSSPKEVWEVLTDFAKYSTWNPFIKSLKGKVQEGSKIDVEVDGMRFRPVVKAFKRNVELRWLGHLWFKGLFDGEHAFTLEQLESDKTRFVQSERFNGVLVPLLQRKLMKDTKDGFEAMNRSLKARVEQISSDGVSTGH